VCTNQGFKSFVPSNELTSEFLYWYLRFATPAIQQMGSGTTFKEISGKVAKTIPIAYPDSDEQRRIVEAIETHLSHLDAGVESLERAKMNVERMRASVFRAAVAGDLVPSGGETMMAVLADVCDVVSGATPKGIRAVDGGTVPFFKVGDMNEANGRFMDGSRMYVDSPSVNALKLKVHPVGTVIFPKRGGAILTNKKRVLVVPSTFDLNTMGVVPGDDVHPTYLWLWFESLDLATFSDGSNVPQINHGDIKPLTIPLPPMSEQGQIVEEAERRLSLIDETESTIRATSRRATSLRSSVLASAFAGNLT
jgi:type I restriction enzyme S subunit